jgi:4-phytase / acid phosphatase
MKKKHRFAATFLLMALTAGAYAVQARGQTTATAAQRPAAGDKPELQLVVALFRHGARAPLKDFGENANNYSNKAWPKCEDWHVEHWGDLTPQGGRAVQALGYYYGDYYKKNGLPGNFKAYLWADGEDERTRTTAMKLKAGLADQGIEAQVDYLSSSTAGLSSEDQSSKAQSSKDLACKDDEQVKIPDPLFHPFKANCGDPAALAELARRNAGEINKQVAFWRRHHTKQQAMLEPLYGVLACPKASVETTPVGTAPHCKPLSGELEKITAWSGDSRGSSPIVWKGKFPYASSATEAFLLECATGMPEDNVAWGNMKPRCWDGSELKNLLRLHELYFDETDRRPDLALVQGSNLVRELRNQLNRKANRPIAGECPHGDGKSQLVGLVGHDTNLATVGALLRLRWLFIDKTLPPDLRDLPANDALPAGALVVELWKHNDVRKNDVRKNDLGTEDRKYFVRIQYVTQSITQMNGRDPRKQAYRIPVGCFDSSGTFSKPCEMSLDSFNNVVEKAIGKDNGYLSRCDAKGVQVCGK